MALRTGEKVKVPFDFQDREETLYLNENATYGRTQDLQTERAIYTFAVADGSSSTTSVTSDFILTNIAIKIRASAGSSSASAVTTIYINNQVIRTILMTNNTTATDDAQLTEMLFIPNWLIRRGENLTVTVANSANSGVYSEVSYIGYLA